MSQHAPFPTVLFVKIALACGAWPLGRLACCARWPSSLAPRLSYLPFSCLPGHLLIRFRAQERVDLKTGDIESRTEIVHKFRWAGGSAYAPISIGRGQEVCAG